MSACTEPMRTGSAPLGLVAMYGRLNLPAAKAAASRVLAVAALTLTGFADVAARLGWRTLVGSRHGHRVTATNTSQDQREVRLAVCGEPGSGEVNQGPHREQLATRRSDDGRSKLGRVRLGERGDRLNEVVILNPHFLPGQPPTLTSHQHGPTIRDQMLAGIAGPILSQMKDCGITGLNTKKKHTCPH
jgi:hypothetical protein